MYSPVVLVLVGAFFLETTNADQHSSLPRFLQEVVDKWISQQAAGCVASAVVSPSSTAYFFGGQLSADNPSLPNEHTLFEIGSITKGFTGLLLADEILSGNVLLNDTLSTLLTDWSGRLSSPAGNVNLLELATHSSGLPKLPSNLFPAPLPDNPYANYTTEKLYQWLGKAELINRGSFLYSNAGAGTLGHALEVNRQTKYEDLLKKRVLLPLGLRDTTITLNNDQKSRLAPGHNHTGEPVSNWDLNVLAPAGALRSTASDLADFVQFATGIKATQKTLAEALKIATQPRKKAVLDYPYDQATIGLFWFQSALPNETQFVFHEGDTAGYSSVVGWVPEKQVGIVVLTNVRPVNASDDLVI